MVHAARMTEIRNACRFLVQIAKDRIPEIKAHK
jgi:hypothetical protein